MNIVKSAATIRSAGCASNSRAMLVEKDLDEEAREDGRRTPFQFLRATYWRWAETILECLPAI